MTYASFKHKNRESIGLPPLLKHKTKKLKMSETKVFTFKIVFSIKVDTIII